MSENSTKGFSRRSLRIEAVLKKYPTYGVNECRPHDQIEAIIRDCQEINDENADPRA